MPTKIEFNKNQIDDVAKELMKETKERVFCFYGEMGAGKTTLIKALLKELDIEDVGNSPTFGIVNEYRTPSSKLLAYHFDFYRIENEEEAYDIGLEDYISTDTYIFIEWPEKIPTLIPINATKVQLHFIDENTRCIEY